MKRLNRRIKLVLVYVFIVNLAFAQPSRTQYPRLITGSFFEINLGYINYPFTAEHLENGYEVEEITIPHVAPRIIPFGHNFNSYLSAQISYMRPVLWVRYKNVTNQSTGYSDFSNHPVFMNVGGITLKARLPLSKKLTVFAESGLSVVTRSGFQENDNPSVDIITNTGYASIQLGTGLKYHVNDKWDLQYSMNFTPGKEKNKQPYTIFNGLGFAFTMGKLPEEKVEENAKTKYFFPHQMIQFGYSTNALGYGVNNFVSQGAVPIFWGGYAEIGSGFTINYQRNVFHGKKIFSLDWGVDFGYWVSNVQKQKFVTLSVFPMFRFSVLHTKPVDLYLNYSLAGPSYISGRDIDNQKTGPAFTFQDFMGMGMYWGQNRTLNTEIRIVHYSNGNLFPENEGVMIPLTFNIGYVF